MNAKSGLCPEDCGYCSQSVHHKSGLNAGKLMDASAVLSAAADAKAAGSQRFCMRGLSEANGSWNTICIERRTGRNSLLLKGVMSVPLSLMLPEVGSTSRSTVRATVDLPQPDSPTSPSVSPTPSEKLTPSTACG